MRSCVSILVIGLLAASTATAQREIPLKKIDPPPGFQNRAAQAPAQPAGPQGEQKLRWICRQLRLDDQQMQQAEALIAVYNAQLEEMKENAAELLRQIQDKYSEIQAAKAEDNPELVKQLQDELRDMAPGVRGEKDFLAALEPVLNEKQKAKLPQVLERAGAVGDIALRPIHVLRAARRLPLSADQNRQLEAVLEAYRDNLMKGRPANQVEVDQRVEQLVQDVRAILTPEQAAAYDEQIEQLREDPPAAKAVQIPDNKPKTAKYENP